MSRSDPERRAPTRDRLEAVLGVGGLVVALALGGCGPASPEGEAALSTEEYVVVMAALREAERELAEDDSAGVRFERRKSEILAEHGVTEEEILDFLRAHWEDPRALQQIWDTLSERLKYLPDEDAVLDPEDFIER